VILDAFLGDSSPSHLLTREAFSSIRRVLRPGGALVINSFGNLEPGHDFFVTSLDSTLKAVFASVHLHTATSDGGMFFVASDRSPLTFVRPPDLQGIHPLVVDDAEATFNHIVETLHHDDGLVLTDDYNPAEFYDAKNREEIRHNLAMHARDL
jgi:spermidine synthase